MKMLKQVICEVLWLIPFIPFILFVNLIFTIGQIWDFVTEETAEKGITALVHNTKAAWEYIYYKAYEEKD